MGQTSLKEQVVDCLEPVPGSSVSEYIIHLIVDEPLGSVDRSDLHRACIDLVREGELEIVESLGGIRYRIPPSSNSSPPFETGERH
jgi:hypothetical protein